jgi:hypothetical protein
MFSDQKSQAKVGHQRSNGWTLLTESKEEKTAGKYLVNKLDPNNFPCWVRSSGVRQSIISSKACMPYSS